MSTIVTTQQELDAALAKPGWTEIVIKSPRGVWLEISDNNGKDVTAYGSSTVTAYDSSTVRASGSSTVRAYDSSTVRASGSSTVRAYDSSTVRAYDSSTVRASDSSTVTAYDSSTVTAYDSSTVRAGDHTAVHLHSKYADITGGVVIDHTTLDLSTHDAWAAYHGTEIVGDEVIVYKAVNDDLKSARGFVYPIGDTVECPDWVAGDFCGNGLHLSPSPVHAQYYFDSATRFLKCAVPVAESTLIAPSDIANMPKLKAKTVRILAEVNVQGIEISTAQVAK